MRIIAFMTEAPAVRQISRAWARPLHRCASRRLASHRCGRCRMPGRTRLTPRPSRRRTTSSINASRGRDSLTRIRSRSSGTARAMGHESGLVGRPGRRWAVPRVAILARFSGPSARSCRTMIAVRANTAQILAEVALALLSFYVYMERGSRSHHCTKRLMSAIPARMMIWSLGFVARLPTLPPDSCSAACEAMWLSYTINVVWRLSLMAGLDTGATATCLWSECGRRVLTAERTVTRRVDSTQV